MTGMDMTRGKIAPLLARFAAPLMMSEVLQQMYSLCDSLVVGRLIGLEAFAAVGASSFLSMMPLSMLLGLTHGFEVVLSQRFGAGDEKGLKWAFRASMMLGVLIALLMTAAGLIFLEPLLTLMRTPSEMLEFSERYLRVVFMGLSLSAMYNIAAAMLRANGDSRTPFVALVIATVLNIALDYVLIAWAGMGVEGVALATVLAQMVSFAYCMIRLRRATANLPTAANAMAPECIFRQLLALGMPPMFRDGMVGVGGLFVQGVINGFGVEFVAGMTAARKYFSLMQMVCCGLEGALATFVGQNTGADNRERVHEGIQQAVRMGLAASLVTAGVTIAFAKVFINLLIAASNSEALMSGVSALRMMAVFLPELYMLCLYRAAIQSMGDSIIPMWSGFMELAMRMLCVLLLPVFIGRTAAYFADGAGWVAAMILLMTTYYRRRNRSRTA